MLLLMSMRAAYLQFLMVGHVLIRAAHVCQYMRPLSLSYCALVVRRDRAVLFVPYSGLQEGWKAAESNEEIGR